MYFIYVLNVFLFLKQHSNNFNYLSTTGYNILLKDRTLHIRQSFY